MYQIDKLPLAETEAQDTGSIVMANGFSSIIERSSDEPGICYKTPYDQSDESIEELKDEKTTHDVLVALHVPTIDEYEIIEDEVLVDGVPTARHRVRMTDLSDGGRNFVFSSPDAYIIKYQYPGIQDWYRFGWTKPVYNTNDFFDQLQDIMDRTSTAHGMIAGQEVDGFKVRFPGFMLVAHPDGILETRVGDFHDGTSLKANRDPRDEYKLGHPLYYAAVASYATNVARFFPELAPAARAFIHRVSNEKCPPALNDEPGSIFYRQS